VLVSLAPSTKIDETYYHMLIGQRIVADHGLRVYQLPYEQAIVPQIGYQVGEAVFHAWGVMDGGNVLSLGFGLALLLMLYGVVAEETASAKAGLIAAAAGAVGLYPAVWHVTAGAHALGDLAMFTAIAALLFPGRLVRETERDGQKQVLACILAAAMAASTKISLVPPALMISAFACWQTRHGAWPRVMAAGAMIWAAILGPLVVWSLIHTHSPTGAAFAGAFGQSVYIPEVTRAMAVSRSDNRLGPAEIVANTVLLLNGLSLALIAIGGAACWRRGGMGRAFLGLIAVQLGLIAMLLPYEFRFLGGLQYALIVAGAITLARGWPFRWVRRADLAACALLAPWLVVEGYYTLPMMRVALGLTTRAEFADRYVAFAADFRALDRVLPADAVLLAPGERLPSVYSPRPVIFDRADWDGRSPLFALTTGGQTAAGCGAVVYRNPAAVIYAYRTPGRESDRASLAVQRCDR